ncbi:MAG: hypothetical protein ACETV0_06870 [Nitrososphaeria archaeon]
MYVVIVCEYACPRALFVASIDKGAEVQRGRLAKLAAAGMVRSVVGLAEFRFVR